MMARCFRGMYIMNEHFTNPNQILLTTAYFQFFFFFFFAIAANQPYNNVS